MHIICTICSDLVNQADSIYITKCGHLFHHHCLSQWIERSKSCPQCRNKVTERCMFRLYATISNENSADDVTTLQSKLDDALLQLRQCKATYKDKEEKLAAISADLKRNEDLLKAYEKKLVSRDSAVNALKEQLEYLKIQNKETNRLKEENQFLHKSIETLDGLRKVLNTTAMDVENMLEEYTDVKTIAIFTTALKRALCESEAKKNEYRNALHSTRQQLAKEEKHVKELKANILQLETRVSSAERRYKCLKMKRKASESPDKAQRQDSTESAAKHLRPSPSCDRHNDAIIVVDDDNSFNTMVNKIETADSPYLSLKQSSLALSTLQRAPAHCIADNKMKPSEFAIINSARNANKKLHTENIPRSIFHKKQPAKLATDDKDMNISQFDVSYDGLGGHSKLDTFPQPITRPPLKSCVPKLTAKHKLKRPNPAGSQDISKMLEKIKDK